MAEVGSLFVRLRADASEFEEALSGIGGEFKNKGKGIQSAGTSMSKSVTAPLVGIAGAAVAVGSNFDFQMARVQAISGATDSEFQDLRDTALDLGSSTKYTATQAAEGLEYMALAGWDANQSTAALPGVLALAAAGNMDLGRTSDIVTDTMSAFGVEAKDAISVADMFAAAQSKSNTNVEQLGEAFKYAGPQAAAAGMDISETSAALGVLADSGLKGSMAGTTLNGMLRDLLSNVEDGKVNFGDFAVEIFDAEGNMRDFGDIMRDVENGTAGMNDAQRESALRSVFQAQSLRGVNVMLATGMDRYDELNESIRDSNGLAQQQASIMSDTVRGGFTAMSSAMEGVLIQLSDVLTPLLLEHVIPALQGLIGMISGVVEWFSNLNPTIQAVIIVIAGILAAIGPLLVVFGTLGIMIGGAITAFATLAPVLAVVLSPIGLIVLAISGLVAGFIIAYKTSETFRNIVHGAIDAVRAVAERVFNGILSLAQSVWPSIQSAIEAAVGAVRGVIETVFPIVQSIVETVFGGIRALALEIWPEIQQIIGTVVEIVATLVETAFNDVQRVVDAVWPHVQTVIETVMGSIQSVIQTVLGIVQGVWERAGEGILAHVRVVWDTIKGVIDGVMNVIAGILETVMGVISGDWNRAWDGIKQALEGAWTIIKSIVRLAISQVKTILKVGWALVQEVFEAAWAKLSEAVSNGIDTVLDFMRKLPGRIVDAVGDLSQVLVQAGKDAIQGLIDGMLSMGGALKDKALDIGKSALDALKSPFSFGSPSKVTRQYGVWVVEGITEGMDEEQQAAAKKAADVAKSIISAINASLDLGERLANIGPLGEITEDLKGQLRNIISSVVSVFDDFGQQWDEEVLARVSAASNAIKGVFGPFAEALDFIQRVQDVTTDQFAAWTTDLEEKLWSMTRDVFGAMDAFAADFEIEVYQPAQAAANALRGIFEPFAEALDFVQRLQDVTLDQFDGWTTALEEKLWSITMSVFGAMDAFAADWDVEVYQAAQAAANALRGIFGPFTEALDFVKAIQDTTLDQFDVWTTELDEKLWSITMDVVGAMDAFAARFDVDIYQGASDAAQAISGIFGPFKEAIDFIKGAQDFALSDMEVWTDDLEAGLTSLIKRITDTVISISKTFEAETIDAAKKFAEAVKPMFDVVGSVAASVSALVDMGEVSEQNIGTFERNIERVVDAISRLKELALEGIEDAQIFRQLMEEISGALQAGAQVFGGPNTPTVATVSGSTFASSGAAMASIGTGAIGDRGTGAPVVIRNEIGGRVVDEYIVDVNNRHARRTY